MVNDFLPQSQAKVMNRILLILGGSSLFSLQKHRKSGPIPNVMFEGHQHLHDPEKAAEFARALGLMVGGAGHPFVGDWGVKGLYAYHSGKYKGIAYFGTGGSERDRLTMPHESEKYRPWNRYDPDIPAHIRKKLVELEDDDSTSIGQYPQSATTPFTGGMLQGENILVSEHSLPKYNGIYTIQNNEINGKPWFKNNSGCILYFYNANSGGGPSWSLDDRSQDGTNDWFRGGWIEPPNSGGPPLGTRRWAILETHRRFEIKMESVSIPDESDEPILNSDNGMLQGEISLKSVHGKYLNATPEGRAQWDDDVAHVGEYFRVEQRQNGKIALMSAFDMYVSAQPDGSVEINRREAPPGGWEEFTVEYRSNDVVCLKSCHGKYLSAQQDGTAQWNRDHAPIGGWEEIQIEQYRETSEPILSESIPNSDLKYVFAHEHMDWHWHNDRARAMGGHIASVTSAEENEDITRISGGAPVWLGGIRKGDRYRGKPLAVADRKPGDPGEVGPGAEDWYWSDDRPWSYTNWGPGEPNNWDAGENRVQHLGKFGAVWNDVGEDWEGPAVYRIPAKSTPSSVSVPRDESTDAVKLNPDITDEVDAETNKNARIALVVGIILFNMGLPLLIIGKITDGEDNLAMIIPGAILFGVGAFVVVCASFVLISSRSKSYVETDKPAPAESSYSIQLEDMSFWDGITEGSEDNRSYHDKLLEKMKYPDKEEIEQDIQSGKPLQKWYSHWLHDPAKSAELAKALGLVVGGAGYDFEGSWGTKGLYAYRSGKYSGHAYFGTGGSDEDRLEPEDDDDKYRPWDRNDPKTPENIRKIWLEIEPRLARSYYLDPPNDD